MSFCLILLLRCLGFSFLLLILDFCLSRCIFGRSIYCWFCCCSRLGLRSLFFCLIYGCLFDDRSLLLCFFFLFLFCNISFLLFFNWFFSFDFFILVLWLLFHCLNTTNDAEILNIFLFLQVLLLQPFLFFLLLSLGFLFSFKSYFLLISQILVNSPLLNLAIVLLDVSVRQVLQNASTPFCYDRSSNRLERISFDGYVFDLLVKSKHIRKLLYIIVDDDQLGEIEQELWQCNWYVH